MAREWEVVRLPALDDQGRSLWPSRRPVAWLEERREAVGPYTWSAQWQGSPRPESGNLFAASPWLVDSLPDLDSTPHQWRIGADFAYSGKKRTDFQAIVTLMRAGPLTYVADVVRVRERIDQFVPRLAAHASRFPQATVHAYVAATETAIEGSLRAHGVRVSLQTTGARNKFARAEPVAAAWNATTLLDEHGRPRPPRIAVLDRPWTTTFVDELRDFTGLQDAHDDQVDALAAAWDGFTSAPSGIKFTSARESEAAALTTIL